MRKGVLVMGPVKWQSLQDGTAEAVREEAERRASEGVPLFEWRDVVAFAGFVVLLVMWGLRDAGLL